MLPIGVIPATWLAGNTMPSNLTYQPYYPLNVTSYQITNNGGAVTPAKLNVPNQTNLFGYTRPYSASFNKGMN